jgi:hypothetical protein
MLFDSNMNSKQRDYAMDNNYNFTTNKLFLWELNSFFRISRHATNELKSTISFAEFVDTTSTTHSKTRSLKLIDIPYNTCYNLRTFNKRHHYICALLQRDYCHIKLVEVANSYCDINLNHTSSIWGVI